VFFNKTLQIFASLPTTQLVVSVKEFIIYFHGTLFPRGTTELTGAGVCITYLAIFLLPNVVLPLPLATLCMLPHIRRKYRSLTDQQPKLQANSNEHYYYKLEPMIKAIRNQISRGAGNFP
jgi:hypothetical protein